MVGKSMAWSTCFDAGISTPGRHSTKFVVGPSRPLLPLSLTVYTAGLYVCKTYSIGRPCAETRCGAQPMNGLARKYELYSILRFLRPFVFICGTSQVQNTLQRGHFRDECKMTSGHIQKKVLGVKITPNSFMSKFDSQFFGLRSLWKVVDDDWEEIDLKSCCGSHFLPSPLAPAPAFLQFTFSFSFFPTLI